MADLKSKQIEILQVAEKLFSEHGFDGTSIREIAKSANINIAMVSYYFGSKEKLLEAIIINRIFDLRLEMDNLLTEEVSPIQKINQLIEFYITRLNKNRYMYQILLFEVFTKKRDVNYDAFIDVKKYNLKVLNNIIEDGQEKGVFKKNINVTLIPSTIIGTYFHFHMNKQFNIDFLELKNDEEYNQYINTTLIKHIQQTIKALLTHEQ